MAGGLKEEEGPDIHMLEGREANVEKEEVCAKELTEKTLETKEEASRACRKGIVASSTPWDTGWLLLRGPCR